MEHHRRESSSADKFSFPIIPIPDYVTSGSPNSPADRLFSNGKLLPHPFPCQTTNNLICFQRSTSSVSSKDSLISSRSNSTNSSRSSSCNSARTSTSEATGSTKLVRTRAKVASKIPVEKDLYRATKKPVLTPHYGSSQRWQFIAPVPALKHQVSRARKAKRAERDQEFESKKQNKDWTIDGTWFGLRIFRGLVSTCKECHAIKPSARKRLDKK